MSIFLNNKIYVRVLFFVLKNAHIYLVDPQRCRNNCIAMLHIFFVCQKYSSFLVSTNINMRMKVPIYLLHKYRNGEKLIYASQKCMGVFTIETGGAAVCMRYLFFFEHIAFGSKYYVWFYFKRKVQLARVYRVHAFIQFLPVSS